MKIKTFWSSKTSNEARFNCSNEKNNPRKGMFLTVILAVLLSFIGNTAIAQENNASKYLKGAVQVENGMVVFSKTYKASGKTKAQLYEALKDYIEKQVVEGENHLEQSRITELDKDNGTIVASMEEWLYFKKKAWVTNRTRFFYQLVAQADEGSFKIEVRRIYYIYDEGNPANANTAYRAEDWITDAEALNKAGTKLTKMAGKFRKFTIDRKDELFRGAARATGALKKVVKTIEVEE